MDNDKSSQRAVNNKALAGLVSAGLTEDQGKAVILAVARGDVPHMSVNY